MCGLTLHPVIFWVYNGSSVVLFSIADSSVLKDTHAETHIVLNDIAVTVSLSQPLNCHIVSEY